MYAYKVTKVELSELHLNYFSTMHNTKLHWKFTIEREEEDKFIHFKF